MRTPVILGYALFLSSLSALGAVVRGTLLNGDDPYIIKGDDGSIYKAEWYSGSILFYEGDQVMLTDGYGQAQMIDEDQDEVADVLVEEISRGYPYPRVIPRPMPVPIPSPTEEATPLNTSALRLNQFVKDFVTSGNYNDPEKETSFYADQVDYFGNGKVTKAFIIDDVKRYGQRWPRRAYHLSGEPEITVVDPARDIARAVINFQFTVGNAQKTIWGSGQEVVLIGNANTDPKVISVKSNILNQHDEPISR